MKLYISTISAINTKYVFFSNVANIKTITDTVKIILFNNTLILIITSPFVYQYYNVFLNLYTIHNADTIVN